MNLWVNACLSLYNRDIWYFKLIWYPQPTKKSTFWSILSAQVTFLTMQIYDVVTYLIEVVGGQVVSIIL